LTLPRRPYIFLIMKFSRKSLADTVIFLGLAVNVVVIVLILYFFVF
jgi:hypothetical protein